MLCTFSRAIISILNMAARVAFAKLLHLENHSPDVSTVLLHKCIISPKYIQNVSKLTKTNFRAVFELINSVLFL